MQRCQFIVQILKPEIRQSPLACRRFKGMARALSDPPSDVTRHLPRNVWHVLPASHTTGGVMPPLCSLLHGVSPNLQVYCGCVPPYESA